MVKKKVVKKVVKKVAKPKDSFYVGKDWKVEETILNQKPALIINCGEQGLSEDKTGRVEIIIREK